MLHELTLNALSGCGAVPGCTMGGGMAIEPVLPSAFYKPNDSRTRRHGHVMLTDDNVGAVSVLLRLYFSPGRCVESCVRLVFPFNLVRV